MFSGNLINQEFEGWMNESIIRKICIYLAAGWLHGFGFVGFKCVIQFKVSKKNQAANISMPKETTHIVFVVAVAASMPACGLVLRGCSYLEGVATSVE